MTHHEEDAWTAFCEVVSEDDHDAVLTAMAEAAHDDKYETEWLKILHRTKHDVINVSVEGVLTWHGTEYTFHLQDGNWNGTELLGFDYAGREYSEPEPVIHTFQPKGYIIAKVTNEAEAKFLLAKWDAFKGRNDVSETIRKYLYDRFFQPGGKIEGHYKQKFDGWGLEVVTEETAAETRKRIESYITT